MMYEIGSESIETIIDNSCSYMLGNNDFQIRKTSNILRSIAEPNDNLSCYMDRLIEIEKMIDNKNKEETKEGIVLTTIHASKGLEYKRVFIVDLYDGVFPTKGAEKENRLLEEERRVMYVAITRAKDELYIYNMKDNYSCFYEELIKGRKLAV